MCIYLESVDFAGLWDEYTRLNELNLLFVILRSNPIERVPTRDIQEQKVALGIRFGSVDTIFRVDYAFE